MKSNTISIRVFLSGASKDTTLSDELQPTSSDLILQSEIPYAPLRALWMASNPSTGPDLTLLFSGTRFVFSSPKPREKNAAGGILGLVGAMLVETFLFIIRSSNADANKTRKFSQKPRPSFFASSLKKNQ